MLNEGSESSGPSANIGNCIALSEKPARQGEPFLDDLRLLFVKFVRYFAVNDLPFASLMRLSVNLIMKLNRIDC